MKKTTCKTLEEGRIITGKWSTPPGVLYGAFIIHAPGGRFPTRLKVISSGEAHGDKDDLGLWEHVSVTVDGKFFTPTWSEMCFVKGLFWEEEETVIQYHPPESEYINQHPGCLHLWKPPFDIITPPWIAVGLKQA